MLLHSIASGIKSNRVSMSCKCLELIPYLRYSQAKYLNAHIRRSSVQKRALDPNSSRQNLLLKCFKAYSPGITIKDVGLRVSAEITGLLRMSILV